MRIQRTYLNSVTAILVAGTMGSDLEEEVISHAIN